MAWYESLIPKFLSDSSADRDAALQLTEMEYAQRLLEAGLSTRDLDSLFAMADQGRIAIDAPTTSRLIQLLNKNGQELQEFRRVLEQYDQDESMLDTPREIYGGMTQRDMNVCCASIRASIREGSLNDRHPNGAKDVQALLKDFFCAGLRFVDAEAALEDENTDIFCFFAERRKAHKAVTPAILAGPLDAPRVISIFAHEMLNGMRVGKVYLEWAGCRASG